MPNTPKFADPPVREVGLGIQFGALQALRGVHVGLFWSSLRESFPVISEVAPLPPMFETFGGLRNSQGSLQFLPPFSAPRILLQSGDEQWVLQVQQDRFLLNWRSMDRFPYPEWESLAPRFKNELNRFTDFLHEEQLGGIAVNQVEVSYYNSIPIDPSADHHDQLEKITPLFTNVTTQVLDLEPDSIVLNYRRIMRRGDERVGRTHVDFSPGIHPNSEQQIYGLNITSRGRPTDVTIEAAGSFLNDAHDAVVNTFATVTNEELHQKWGRYERR